MGGLVERGRGVRVGDCKMASSLYAVIDGLGVMYRLHLSPAVCGKQVAPYEPSFTTRNIYKAFSLLESMCFVRLVGFADCFFSAESQFAITLCSSLKTLDSLDSNSLYYGFSCAPQSGHVGALIMLALLNQNMLGKRTDRQSKSDRWFEYT